MKIKKMYKVNGINDFNRLRDIPPKCYVCGHNLVMSEGVFWCQNCGQIYDDN